MVIPVFFVVHWVLSVFMQSFFLHRYAAHRMYSVGPRTERALYLLTWICQGSSFLLPRAYAILHRWHHAFSDTERDPHSPVQNDNIFTMMWRTRARYGDVARRRVAVESRFEGGYPEWPALDRIGESLPGRLAWVAVYAVIYALFATAWWQWLLLPVTITMGPVHGAIVNWCGHKYGYRNYPTDDDSRNTLPFDVVCLGELFQNNHHRHSRRSNFATRRFEIDPTYQVMRGLDRLGIIRLLRPGVTTTSRAA